MKPSPRLVIEVFENEPAEYGGFGPGALKFIIHDAINVGWSWYSRYPGQCFFTLPQRSPFSKDLVPGLDHIRIWFTDRTHPWVPWYQKLVFNGRLGDADESGDDLVWNGYNYLADLALSRTGYRVMYSGAKISKCVRAEWKRDAPDSKAGKKKFRDYGAKKRSYSLSGHIKTGTIQNPRNDSGAQVKLDPQFGVIDVPRLLLFYDLTEIGRANTSSNVTYEITRAKEPKFNFWRDKGDHLPDLQLNYPGNIRDFRLVRGVTNIRNDIATIGIKRGQAVEIQREKSAGYFGYENFGRRQDSFAIKTLAGYKNLDDDAGKFSAQKMITKRAVKEATVPMRSLQVDVPWQHLRPFDGYDIEDTVDVRIKTPDGDTALDMDYRILGVTGVMDDTGYHQTLYIVTDDDGVDD